MILLDIQSKFPPNSSSNLSLSPSCFWFLKLCPSTQIFSFHLRFWWATLPWLTLLVPSSQRYPSLWAPCTKEQAGWDRTEAASKTNWQVNTWASSELSGFWFLFNGFILVTVNPTRSISNLGMVNSHTKWCEQLVYRYSGKRENKGAISQAKLSAKQDVAKLYF